MELRCAVPASTPYDVYDIYAVVGEGSGATSRCRPLGVCHAVQAELYYVAPDRVRLAIANASGKGVSGLAEFSLPAGVAADPARAPFAVEAGGKSELFFTLGGLEGVRTREHMKATLSYGAERAVAYELVQPAILNGGFEQDTAGDNYPDYWNYRFPDDLYLTKGVGLDRTIFAEGRQSLRLEPNPRDTRNHVLTTFLKLVPATRYRLSCRIRRSANDPNVGVRLFSLYSKDGKSSAVDVYAGYQKDGPVNEWQEFSREFTTADLDVPYNLLLADTGYSSATVWFDDVRLEVVK